MNLGALIKKAGRVQCLNWQSATGHSMPVISSPVVANLERAICRQVRLTEQLLRDMFTNFPRDFSRQMLQELSHCVISAPCSIDLPWMGPGGRATVVLYKAEINNSLCQINVPHSSPYSHLQNCWWQDNDSNLILSCISKPLKQMKCSFFLCLLRLLMCPWCDISLRFIGLVLWDDSIDKVVI